MKCHVCNADPCTDKQKCGQFIVEKLEMVKGIAEKNGGGKAASEYFEKLIDTAKNRSVVEAPK